MGFFAWVGGLIDELLAWLGRACKAFIEGLVWALEKIWQTAVVSLLFTAFGAVATLYVIFYAGFLLGETIMEVWDPRYANSKPSEVINVKQSSPVLGLAPQNSPLPTQRSEARILTLENWQY
ncbi:hypothetical protein NG799_26195 [Laspinema sp. D1]|uniref:Uncharacterized protein n=1 Tax=Laspinema palackyanum D2a TaxID=2953684 RepID=A0ABT2N0P9_9CYAN|nr:hypothetical protein [Laspinema sp. D2a]